MLFEFDRLRNWSAWFWAVSAVLIFNGLVEYCSMNDAVLTYCSHKAFESWLLSAVNWKQRCVVVIDSFNSAGTMWKVYRVGFVGLFQVLSYLMLSDVLKFYTSVFTVLYYDPVSCFVLTHIMWGLTEDAPVQSSISIRDTSVQNKMFHIMKSLEPMWEQKVALAFRK